jgi:ribosomal-protein-alanine N-acetyltransferase
MKISSSQLKFKPLLNSDFSLYARLAMNENVMKYITGHALTFEQAELRFHKAVDAHSTKDDSGFFIVIDKTKGDFIGVAKLIQVKDSQFEVGYMLLPQYWGKGYATGMVEEIINLARKIQISELIGIVDPDNPASIRVLDKFGFKLYETGQIDGLAAAYYKLELNKTILNKL